MDFRGTLYIVWVIWVARDIAVYVRLIPSGEREYTFKKPFFMVMVFKLAFKETLCLLTS